MYDQLKHTYCRFFSLLLLTFLSIQTPGWSQSYTPVGPFPLSIVAADFTGSGLDDLATTNTDAFTVSQLKIFLNNGSGTFVLSQTITLSTVPRFCVLTTGDFFGTGRQDIAVLVQRQPAILLFENIGKGMFDPTPTEIPLNDSAFTITTGHFRGPTAPLDIAISGNNTPGIQLFFNNGSGIFTPGTLISTTTQNIAAADLTGNGFDDLVGTLFNTNSFAVFLNEGIAGEAQFSAPVDYLSGGPQPTALALADFNNDGFIDIAVANNDTNNVCVFLNDGTSNPGTFTFSACYATQFAPLAITEGNFSGNGNNDIATANEAQSSVSILVNKGNGTFNPAINQPVGSGPVSITSGVFTPNSVPTYATVDLGSSTSTTTTKVATTLSLTQSSTSSLLGQSVTFTATVTPVKPTVPAQTGLVTFLNGTTALGTAALSTTGGVTSATFTTTSLPQGTLTITATYGGDLNFTGSTNSVIHIVISILPPTNLRGTQQCNKFLFQTDLINVLTWQPPATGETPVKFLIFRDSLNNKIATVPGNVFKFEDHNRTPGKTYTYFVVSVDAAGNKSTPATVTITPLKRKKIK